MNHKYTSSKNYTKKSALNAVENTVLQCLSFNYLFIYYILVTCSDMDLKKFNII